LPCDTIIKIDDAFDSGLAPCRLYDANGDEISNFVEVNLSIGFVRRIRSISPCDEVSNDCHFHPAPLQLKLV
jgi:hypothetical protein